MDNGDKPQLLDDRSGPREGTAIFVRDLIKTYLGGAVRALDGMNLEVARGEFVAVQGPSGCGKTTLLQLMAGLDRPDSGTMVVDGEDVTHVGDLNRYRAKTIGLVFQLDNLLPTLTALENIQVAMLGQGLDRDARKRRAEQLLAYVGLSDRATFRPPFLSGGQRQRLAIARALANSAPVLLADEPTGRLDSVSGRAVVALLKRIREERGLTIVLVTHDPLIAAQADRVVEMLDGRAVAPVASGTGLCRACGGTLRADALFCSACGAATETAARASV